MFFLLIPSEMYSNYVKKPSLKLKLFLTKRLRPKLSEIHKIIQPLNSTLVPRPQKYTQKYQISHVFVISGGNILQDKAQKTFFLVFLVEFQLYFTRFLKVYVSVLLLKKYLTSNIEKNIHIQSRCQGSQLCWSGWQILTCINVQVYNQSYKKMMFVTSNFVGKGYFTDQNAKTN